MSVSASWLRERDITEACVLSTGKRIWLSWTSREFCQWDRGKNLSRRVRTWSRAAQPRNFRLRPGWVRSHRPQGGHDRRYRGRPGEGHGREHGCALCNDSVPERPGVGGNCLTGRDGTQRTGGDAVPLGPTERTGQDGRGNDSGGGGGLHRPVQGGGGVRAGHGTGTRPDARKASSDADRGSAHAGLHTCDNQGNTDWDARDTHAGPRRLPAGQRLVARGMSIRRMARDWGNS